MSPIDWLIIVTLGGTAANLLTDMFYTVLEYISPGDDDEPPTFV